MPSRPPKSKRRLKPLVVTKRDRLLFAHLASFGVLSTEQIRRLCFTSVSRTRRRLKRLWQHRFVRRNTRPVQLGEGTSPYLYSLTATGRSLAGSGDRDVAIESVALRSLSEHSGQIADVRIAIMRAMSDKSGRKLTTWQQGRHLRFVGNVRERNSPQVVPIVPDAFFAVKVDGGDFAYLLEVDRGTTDLTRIRTKFLAYIDLWQSRAVQERLAVRSFRVLYVTTTGRRLANMVGVLQGMQSLARRRDIFLITRFERLDLDRPEHLLGPIWTTIAPDGLPVLVPLLPAPLPETFPAAPGNTPVRGPNAGAR